MFSSKRKYTDDGDSYQTGMKRPGSPYPRASPGLSLIHDPSHAYPGKPPPPFPVVRLRGLPFECEEFDVFDFFHGLDILDILFVHKGGRFSGEAFCVLAYPLQVDFALQKNREHMGHRYVEVFRSDRQEYYSAVARELSDARGSAPRRTAPRAKSSDNGNDAVEHTGILRMRGLPYSAGKDDVLDFFKQYELSEDCIHMSFNSDGRPTGEAYVQFSTAEYSKAAMAKDRMTLGNRYIELFPSNQNEMDEAISKSRGKG